MKFNINIIFVLLIIFKTNCPIWTTANMEEIKKNSYEVHRFLFLELCRIVGKNGSFELPNISINPEIINMEITKMINNLQLVMK